MNKHLGDLLNMPGFQALLHRRIQEGWTFEKIEPMSSEEIFSRLNRLGIPVTPEGFRQDAGRHELTERLADEWCAQYTLRPEGRYDEDRDVLDRLRDLRAERARAREEARRARQKKQGKKRPPRRRKRRAK